jgi:hypothetical protein
MKFQKKKSLKMAKIIFVPQFPANMRYQEWWFNVIPHEFECRGHEVLVLGKQAAEDMQMRRGLEVWFSDINMSIEFECNQIKEYRLLDVSEYDILFHTDLSFPGLFHNVLFHRRPEKCFVFCHATAANYLDYYSGDYYPKFPIERLTADLYDKVFVGSYYHKNKIQFRNSVVTYLPDSPFMSKYGIEKEYDIISVARPTPQKVTPKIEDEVEASFGPIYRPNSYTWDEYFTNLAKSKILLITSKEDTFNYTVLDAIRNGCIPVAPNKLSFPELLPEAYLYDDIDDLCYKIFSILNNKLSHIKMVPDVLCRQQITNFYDKILKEMLE